MIKVDLVKCTGCMACYNVCGKKAISLVANYEGFCYPTIDEAKCVNCGLCDSVCPLKKQHHRTIEPKVYAIINKNSVFLNSSSSGGAFLLLAEYVFEKKGVVVGCSFDDDLRARHSIVDNMDDCISKLCKSKYVQSDIGSIFSSVKELLDCGRIVFFTGTPCQVDGLRNFLRKDYQHLITADLICHGVSSPVLFKMHKEYLEKAANGKINNFVFRNKKYLNNSPYYFAICYKNGKVKKGPFYLDRYYSDFLKGNNFRESCYSCKYAGTNRCGDFTLGDFWGIEKHSNTLPTKKGVSLFMCNSEKALSIFDCIKNNCFFEEMRVEIAAENNANLIKSSPRPKVRDDYYKFALNDFEKWENSFYKSRYYKKMNVFSKMPLFLKRFFKRLSSRK